MMTVSLSRRLLDFFLQLEKVALSLSREGFSGFEPSRALASRGG